jgi:hypothetical protein
MIDPRTQYILHKEKETDLMHQIERKLAAQERGEDAQTSQPWYSAAEQCFSPPRGADPLSFFISGFLRFSAPPR